MGFVFDTIEEIFTILDYFRTLHSETHSVKNTPDNYPKFIEFFSVGLMFSRPPPQPVATGKETWAEWKPPPCLVVKCALCRAGTYMRRV